MLYSPRMNNTIQNEDRLKAMLKDLGRSTLRGIGRCYKCGTLNGTRGLSCKNKACDVVFAEAGRKKKQSMEVCKLHTGTSPQVFSVRVREKGPDFRGFVQLPAVQTKLDESDTSFLSPVTALCFVDSCQRLFNTNILKCHERDIGQPATTCQHIQSAMRCCSDAAILRIDYKELQMMNTTQFIKDTIWELNQETSGSIVQRVSKTIMAVKNKVSTKHPLGFLHITFYTTSSKWKERDSYHFCTCSSSKNHVKSGDTLKLPKCIHYYACVAAFASDNKLSNEFSVFVLREKIPETYEIDPNDDDSRLVEIFNNTMNQSEEIEVLQKEDDTDFILPALTTELDGLPSIVDVANDLEAGLDTHSLSPVIAKFQDSTLKTKSQAKPRKKRISKGGITKRKEKIVKRDIIEQCLPFSGDSQDPNSVSFSFISWLASVTERINQTMHIQLDGKPEPLIFHIPQAFFDCLGERLMGSSGIGGSKRKRLPNSVTTLTRRTSPPLGTFFSYTWHISSLAHAKAIFDTPIMSLKVSRSFIQKADGTYEDIDPTTLEEGLSRREGERSIRPVEIKTFLKIGTLSSAQESPSILSINWIPNLLPISKIGELKITFEYYTVP